MLNPATKRTMAIVISTAVLTVAIAAYFFVMHVGEPDPNAFEVPSASVKKIKVMDQVEKELETDQQGLSKLTAVILTARGKIKVKFYTQDAPKTVHRIVELIQNKFYDGLIFHRVVPGFVIQGGDPTGSGMGGSGVKLQAEFNSRKHVMGTLSMARASDPNSADSQFYICLGTHPHLDGQYTVFGQVIEGQEVANQIQQGDRMTSVTLE